MGLLHGSVRFSPLLWLAYSLIAGGIIAGFWYLSKDLLINWNKSGIALKQRFSWEDRV
ncbi:MAG: hypothetical protein NWS47_04290 [Alphaproteobacteria bacterium]|nr:hypothetical protein [Alphaproteobacteria bacterium]